MGRDVATLAVLQPGITPGGLTAGAYADQNTYTWTAATTSDDMAGNNTSYVTNFVGIGGSQTNGRPRVMPTPIESIEGISRSPRLTKPRTSMAPSAARSAVTKRARTIPWVARRLLLCDQRWAPPTLGRNHTPVKLNGVQYDHTPLHPITANALAIPSRSTTPESGGKTLFLL